MLRAVVRCVDGVRYGLGACVWGVVALDIASWVFLGREEVSIVGAGIFDSHTYEQFNLISTIQNAYPRISMLAVWVALHPNMREACRPAWIGRRRARTRKPTSDTIDTQHRQARREISRIKLFSTFT